MKFIKGARNWRLILGTQTFLGASPPPPRWSPVSGTADPGVVKQDKSSRGSVDTKTRSGPQRVRLSSGERPIGAAKGKQSNTEALCQTPPAGCSINQPLSKGLNRTPCTQYPSHVVAGPGYC